MDYPWHCDEDTVTADFRTQALQIRVQRFSLEAKVSPPMDENLLGGPVRNSVDHAHPMTITAHTSFR